MSSNKTGGEQTAGSGHPSKTSCTVSPAPAPLASGQPSDGWRDGGAVGRGVGGGGGGEHESVTG